MPEAVAPGSEPAPGSTPPAAGAPPAAPKDPETPPVKPAAEPPVVAKPPAVEPPAVPPAEVGAPPAYALTAPADVVHFSEHWLEKDQRLFEVQARANNWTNDEAQVALDRVPQGHQLTRDAFKAELKADPELGGDNMEKTEANVLRALDHFLPKTTKHGADLRRMVNLTGFGNYPALVAGWSAVGRALAEDDPGILKPKEIQAQDLPAEDVLYPGKGPGGAPVLLTHSA